MKKILTIAALLLPLPAQAQVRDWRSPSQKQEQVVIRDKNGAVVGRGEIERKNDWPQKSEPLKLPRNKSDE